MTTTIYIIPGFGSSCSESPYKKLSHALTKKGYKVVPIDPDWRQPLSGQVFNAKKNSMIVGFSLGAVLAYLVAKEHPVKKVIFASLSPIRRFSYKELYTFSRKYMSEAKARSITSDIKSIKINLKKLGSDYITLSGEYEKVKSDLIVPKVGHKLTNYYVECIVKCV